MNTAALAPILLVPALAGCGSFAQPFIQEPGTFACVRVEWSDAARIRSRCTPGAAACATAGNGIDMQHIWARKPAGFNDYEAVLRLGHEFLHSLGATHE